MAIQFLSKGDLNEKLSIYFGCEDHFFSGSMSGAWEVQKFLAEEGWTCQTQLRNDITWSGSCVFSVWFGNNVNYSCVETSIAADAPVAVAFAALLILEGKPPNDTLKLIKTNDIFSVR